MAKWGQGDPRWIVEERADATNVNNWHWTERDATSWSKRKLKEVLEGLVVEGEAGRCEIGDLKHVEGEASCNSRKGKLIFFYEWNLRLSWKAPHYSCAASVTLCPNSSSTFQLCAPLCSGEQEDLGDITSQLFPKPNCSLH